MKVTSFLQEGTLVWTLTSNSQKYLTLNLVRQIQALRVPWKLCILCADRESLQFFQREFIPARLVLNPLHDTGTSVIPFGTRLFESLNRMKLEWLETFAKDPTIQRGIYLDGDICVQRDFVPDLCERLAQSSAPILFQCDEQPREPCQTPCPNACTGLIAWKQGCPSDLFRIHSIEMWLEKPFDQDWVNGQLRRMSIPQETLPRNLYPNGSFVSLMKAGSSEKKEAYLLHQNYRVGLQKAKDMKRNGDWIIPY